MSDKFMVTPEVAAEFQKHLAPKIFRNFDSASAFYAGLLAGVYMAKEGRTVAFCDLYAEVNDQMLKEKSAEWYADIEKIRQLAKEAS